MGDRTRNRRSSYGRLDESEDISAFFHRDEEYQSRGRTGSAMASYTREQGEPRRAPSILKGRNSSHGKRRSVRFADQEPEAAPITVQELEFRWIWLPKEDTCISGIPDCKRKPEIWDVVDDQEMSGALPTEDCQSTRVWRGSYAPLTENTCTNYLAANSRPENRSFSRNHPVPRPEKKLFSQGNAAANNPILRSPASLIDWIMKGYDDGLRSRHILQELTDILTDEL
ncbi:hypothetical protein MCOR27_003316 [Pyricularia oryzae]|uniref:Uncharacterized protein n=2 Tax=Pyricularia TaxID=48558 RepID=A0ABQ8N6K0_PYRGI|nr:hypothetical protein MCOR01_002905 [Pyricularia oryzae]KAI6292036.1 hypothetical protein MCOR33_010160 [Pyricularia grisea]KAI6259070.1 hypothetical protein MCOR19_004547 [Pyricularia oryzae]KAI6276504.1 hypothetical protein MCOR26_005593 [Pyricularia oryzae]KAI6283253.1 hypothetical protein MCOR27_003316 [Pyricularia oryzae]